MSNHPSGPHPMERVFAAIRKFLPAPGDPPEPYWAIVGVNAQGEATGDLWGAEPRTVTLFESQELGTAALGVVGQPSPEPQVRTVRWEVRGLSREALAWLQGEPTLRPLVGVEIQGGRVATRPL